ncbi:MAG TPA: ribosomal protein L13e [Candidatus Deferrimicrobium sp.]|nr:ribosomal protein L13e [Candidatus Deferrimicrobium sp.]
MSNKTKESRTGPIKTGDKKDPTVKKPKKYLTLRKGRGFSLKEIKSAAIPLDDAKKLDLPIDIRRKSIHDKNVSILSALYRKIVTSRAEENVELDLTKKEAYKELKQLKNIKGNEAKLLIEAGVKSLATLIEEEAYSLADDTKIEAERIEKWIEYAKILIKRKSILTSVNELMQIKGINQAYAHKLVDFGILSIEDLSKEKAEILAKDLKISEKPLESWIDSARELTGKPILKKEKPKEKVKEEKPKEKVKEEKPKEKVKEEKPKEKVKEEKPKEKAKEEKPKEKAKEEKPKEKVKEEKPKEKVKEEKPKEKVKEEKPKEKVKEEKPKEKVKEEKPKEKVKEEKPKSLSLKDIEGIGKGELKKLKDVGITKIEDLIEEDAIEIAPIIDVDQVTLQKWIGAARELIGLPREQEKPKEAEVPFEETPVKEDPLANLLKIEGIGKKTAEKLVEAGITCYEDLIQCDPKELSKKSKVSEKSIQKIIESAKKQLE